jgi:pimeloyl-ACP methyl ester carboxylesterase
VARTMGDYPALGRATREAIPGAQLVELEAVGHLPHIEAHEAFMTAVQEFLAGLP